MNIAKFTCKICRRSFDGTSCELCFECLASSTRAALAGLGSSSSPFPATTLPALKGCLPKLQSKVPESRANKSASKKMVKALSTQKKPLYGEDARNARRDSRAQPIKCGICGKLVSPGEVTAHKLAQHGERPGVAFKSQSKRHSVWISVVSGGLPSLGKRH